MARGRFARPNRGDAWWVKEGMSPGPYDDPELRPTGERCLLGFGSSAGPPALPVLYNNVKQIVQTKDTIMILNEINHDARIIRMNATHEPPEIRRWLGDSIGRWEGDTLVIDTIAFEPNPSGLGLNVPSSAGKHTVERLTLTEERTRLRYEVTVEDPTYLTGPATLAQQWDHRPDLEFSQDTEACDPNVAARYRDHVPK